MRARWDGFCVKSGRASTLSGSCVGKTLSCGKSFAAGAALVIGIEPNLCTPKVGGLGSRAEHEVHQTDARRLSLSERERLRDGSCRTCATCGARGRFASVDARSGAAPEIRSAKALRRASLRFAEDE